MLPRRRLDLLRRLARNVMLDQILLDLPIMSQHGQHVDVQVTPLRKYEDFAADLKERLAK